MQFKGSYLGENPLAVVWDNCLCPVAAITAYLASRGPDPGPLFRFRKGSYLTRDAFVRSVREALTRAGIDVQCYSGHSFRVGAATTAAACGVEDSLIKITGMHISICRALTGSSSSTFINLRRGRLVCKGTTK